MNKKILTISMTLFAVAMLVIPVMAEPINNPHAVLDTTTGETDVLDLNLPSGVTNRWFGDEAHIIVKYADKFHCPYKIDVEDNWFAWMMNPDNRGKWVHMNKGDATTFTGYLGIFAALGLTPPTDVPPEGVYIWGSK
jgi:hypothetical protein